MGWLRFFDKPKAAKQAETPLYLHNTLGNTLEKFTALPHIRAVRMYNCGPTVYGPQHIGNLSMFVFTDVLRRTLEYNGLKVKQVINFTDFGHLTSDADEGEDKMTKGLKREGLKPSIENMRELGERYAKLFLHDIRSLNVETDETAFPRASDYIPAQIAMIKTLEEKGYAYRGGQGVYFDTSRFSEYGKLGNIDLSGLKEGARVASSGEKHHATDFLLWKSSGKLGWDSPWGKGFPGWHIECSAMIRATLGEQIDIHTGGIEHIPVHHNNEIAQSESANGKRPLSRFWLHRAHIQIEGSKIAKSTGKAVYLTDITERKIHPIALRYLFLGAHYRTPANFSWPALEASQTAFLKLRDIVDASPTGGVVPTSYKKRWHERFNDDLDTPGALAAVWEMIGDNNLDRGDVRAGVLDADNVLGLGFAATDTQAESLRKEATGEEVVLSSLPEHVRDLVQAREEARERHNWLRADAIRNELASMSYELKDSAQGPKIFKK